MDRTAITTTTGTMNTLYEKKNNNRHHEYVIWEEEEQQHAPWIRYMRIRTTTTCTMNTLYEKKKNNNRHHEYVIWEEEEQQQAPWIRDMRRRRTTTDTMNTLYEKKKNNNNNNNRQHEYVIWEEEEEQQQQAPWIRYVRRRRRTTTGTMNTLYEKNNNRHHWMSHRAYQKEDGENSNRDRRRHEDVTSERRQGKIAWRIAYSFVHHSRHSARTSLYLPYNTSYLPCCLAAVIPWWSTDSVCLGSFTVPLQQKVGWSTQSVWKSHPGKELDRVISSGVNLAGNSHQGIVN